MVQNGIGDDGLAQVASDSKTSGRGFESYRSCQKFKEAREGHCLFWWIVALIAIRGMNISERLSQFTIIQQLLDDVA